MKEERKEEYIYAGIPTFMGGEFIRENEIKNYDIVFLGVPCDYGASYRLGAKYAPRQLREYSFWDRIYGEELYDLDHSEYLKTNDFKIADLGDVYVNPTHPNENQDAISEKTNAIAKDSFPVICGGDHSITYGCFRGVYRAMKEKYPDYEIGIIHFDAHLDLEDEYLNMPEVWHGNVFRKLIEDGYLKGENLYSIGPRGVVGRQWVDYAKEKGVNIFTSNKVKEVGIVNIIKVSAFALFTGVISTSCLDQLEEETYGKYSADTYFDTTGKMEMAVNGIYETFSLSLIHISEPTRRS